jgi:hypothetical protein
MEINMKNPKLEIYKMLKEKKLVNKPIEEYEEMLKNEDKKTEFNDWHDKLPEEEKSAFDFVFEDE